MGVGLKRTDRIRIVHVTNVLCGDSGAGTMSSHVARGASGGPTTWDTTAVPSFAAWADVSIVNSGSYKMCWCGGKAVDENSCVSDGQFNVDVGVVTVSGPTQTGTFEPVGLGGGSAVLEFWK